MRGKRPTSITMKSMKVNPLEGKILPGMIRFSLPIMAVNLLSMLFSVADTAVIGRFGHRNAVSAIGASSAVIMLLVGALTALSVGVTTVVGNLYGKENKEAVNRTVNALLPTAFILGACLTLLVEIAAVPILQLIHCPSEIFDDALLYFRIYFAGVPFSLGYCFLSYSVQASGDSFHPLLIEMMAAALNIILNLLFVIVFDWNIFGVAVATVISQICSCLGIVIYMANKKDELHLSLKKQKAFTGLSDVFRMGIPSSLESIIMALTGVVISSFLNQFSPDVIAGNTIAQSIEGIITVSFVGFSAASVVFISQNYGAQNKKRILKSFYITMSVSFVLAELIGICVYLMRNDILRLFTTEHAIMETAGLRLFYMCVFFGFCATMNALGGCIRGLNDAKSPLVISILCSVVFRLTWLFTLALPRKDLSLAYVCFPICWILATLLCTLVFVFRYRRIHTDP